LQYLLKTYQTLSEEYSDTLLTPDAIASHLISNLYLANSLKQIGGAETINCEKSIGILIQQVIKVINGVDMSKILQLIEVCEKMEYFNVDLMRAIKKTTSERSNIGQEP
jgi:uncharacterized membrane protein